MHVGSFGGAVSDASGFTIAHNVIQRRIPKRTATIHRLLAGTSAAIVNSAKACNRAIKNPWHGYWQARANAKRAPSFEDRPNRLDSSD